MYVRLSPGGELFHEQPYKRPRLTGDKPACFSLSEQQLGILDCVCAPGHGKLPIVRVTAGAGTGKTETITCVAQRLVEKGHRQIRYLAFNKTQAEDASCRLYQAGDCITASTLHSCAFYVMGFKEHRGAKLKTMMSWTARSSSGIMGEWTIY